MAGKCNVYTQANLNLLDKLKIKLKHKNVQSNLNIANSGENSRVHEHHDVCISYNVNPVFGQHKGVNTDINDSEESSCIGKVLYLLRSNPEFFALKYEVCCCSTYSSRSIVLLLIAVINCNCARIIKHF